MNDSKDFHEWAEHFCGQLEAGWEAALPVDIGLLQAKCPPEFRDQVLQELIALEAELRCNAGQRPSVQDYLDRFPEQKGAVWEGYLKFDPHATRSLGRPYEISQDFDDAFVSGMNGISSEDIPSSEDLGSYDLEERIGDGTFGIVYKARDRESGETVAIKLLKRKWVDSKYREQFICEARRTAKVKHPRVVEVKAEAPNANPPYIVLQYIDGSNLKEYARETSLSPLQVGQLIVDIADALTAIHKEDIYHRDLKPENILIDRNGSAFVADFGLAMDYADRWKLQGSLTGTLLYMSPEQLEGGTHLIGPQSDLWSLGVIFYWLLTQKMPFEPHLTIGSGVTRMFDLRQVIALRPPRAPRETHPWISPHLQQPCMHCLYEDINERPVSAADFRDELRTELELLTREAFSLDNKAVDPSADEPDIFPEPTLFPLTEKHASLYLRLMPKSYTNREELPEQIAYWKRFTECVEKPQMCRVGVLVGVSGCGKSSLLRAGLLPRLSSNVESIAIQASAQGTELQLLTRLRDRFRDEDPKQEWTLPEWIMQLRNSQLLPDGRRLLLVIDQFEQWLHTDGGETTSQLVSALRQCDGIRVQALVCVREGFQASMTQFLKALSVELDEKYNYSTACPFSLGHARLVLEQFGRGGGQLKGELDGKQRQFIQSAVQGLAESDRGVVCIRLVVLAMVMAEAERPWVPEELKSLGGLKQLGMRFLQTTFEGRTSSENYRELLLPATKVMESLLPREGLDIKDARSYSELLSASSMNSRPAEFERLLQLLIGKLFLVTPVDPGDPRLALHDELAVSTSRNTEKKNVAEIEDYPERGKRKFQLTHDFLVPSVRQWVEFVQGSTRSGKARLLMERLTNNWQIDQAWRYLPSLTEFLSICRWTDRKTWKETQRKMMHKAGRVYVTGTSIVGLVICLLVTIGLSIYRQAAATGLVKSLGPAKTDQLDVILVGLKGLRTWANPQLKQMFLESDDLSDAKLHAALALIADSKTNGPPVLDFLKMRLFTVTPAQLAQVLKLLKPHKDRLIPEYWKLATDEGQPPLQRLYAACALAGFDSEHGNWRNAKFTKFLAEQLIAINPANVGKYQELVRPVGPHLVPALSDIFKNPTRGEMAKSVVATMLAEFAAEDTDTLTELILSADVVSDKSLFPILKRHKVAAVNNLEAVLDQRLEPKWNDLPLNAAWTEPSTDVRSKIESAHGLVADRFVFCQDMPWLQFQETVESLRASGYRPTRVRPHGNVLGTLRGDEINVAAIWTRDGKRWRMDAGLAQVDLPSPNTQATKDGLLLSDIAVLPSAGVSGKPQFTALWCEVSSTDEQRRVHVDMNEFQLITAQKQLTLQGFASQNTISVRMDTEGQRRYTGLWSNHGTASKLRSAYAGFELVDQPQWDVAVAPIAKPSDPLDHIRQILVGIEKLVDKDNLNVRKLRASAHFQLGNLESALSDLDFVIAQQGLNTSDLQVRTLILARLGRGPEAKESLAKLLATDASASQKAYVQIQVPAWLGELEEAASQLESSSKSSPHTVDYLYNLAAAAAMSSQACVVTNVIQSQAFADRAIELLKKAVARGYRNVVQIKASVDFANLYGDPKFIELLSELEHSRRFAAVWHADVEYESTLLSAASLDRMLVQLKPMIKQGYRPFAISVDASAIPPAVDDAGESVPAGQQLQTPLGSTLCKIVLHRPVIPDADKEQLALRQAAAATALLRFNATRNIWPMFQDTPDPRVRSYLQHRLASYEINPQSLVDQLTKESDVSRRRSLIQGIGEFARAMLLSHDQVIAAIADMKHLYANDPDSGIHGAAEWTLRQLRAEGAIAEVRKAYATGAAVDSRRWYLTNTETKLPAFAGPTLAIIRPDRDFLMGSPVTEAEREDGPVSAVETRHRRNIGRTFAISMHEITIAQFKVFRSEHNFHRKTVGNGDFPANMITWYEAAAYCNWLSRLEEIPPEQWCYDHNQPFNEGMTLPADYLDRTGYRLPTEAEWEYACRAGTTTARYFGETEALLGEYARINASQEDRGMIPVGTLRPNAFGLFDTLGNAVEWSQDGNFVYLTDRESMIDKEQLDKVGFPERRMMRGGAYILPARSMRSASRITNLPALQLTASGFRIARTLHTVTPDASFR